MARIIGGLLVRAVPVFLITGRGNSARTAARQIQEITKLSPWQLLRLYCVPYNGVYLWYTPRANAELFLEHERAFCTWPGRADFAKTLIKVLNGRAELEGDFFIDQKDHSLRVTTSDQGNSRLVYDIARQLAEDPKWNIRLYVAQGVYSTVYSIDISPTNKSLALDAIAKFLDITRDKILCIGDQGQTGGNDYDLLACAAGFSVENFSKAPDACFPVFADVEGQARRLTGTAATRAILDYVRVFPELSIRPNDEIEYLNNLRRFEQLALTRSRKESEAVALHLRVRLKYLIDEPASNSLLQTLLLEDLFDMTSGGVRLRDWELSEFATLEKARAAFGYVEISKGIKSPGPLLTRSMYVDSGLLLRGPLYYRSFLALPCSGKGTTFTTYLHEVRSFVSDAILVIDEFAAEPPTLVRYKVVLGLLDNSRQVTLTLLSTAFSRESRSAQSFTLMQFVFDTLVLPHTDLHYDFLLDVNLPWEVSLKCYQELLTTIDAALNRSDVLDLGRFVDEEIEHDQKGDAYKHYFRWREADFFLQSITALQLAFHEFQQRREFRVSQFVAVGLAYGGIELPALAVVIGKRRAMTVVPALAHISHYGDEATREKVRAGGADYVTQELEKEKPLAYLSGAIIADSAAKYVLLDDNSTTGLTLQMARDYLVLKSHDVVGAVIVRFPGANRFAHMVMKDHTGIHPDILFNFVRGLVGPSPYARLLFENPNPDPSYRYLDQTQTFDKAKDRVKRYLVKNGTLDSKQ